MNSFASVDAFLTDARTKGHKVFENATMYRSGEFFGNIFRIDVKYLVIEEGVAFAQYSNAIKGVYLEKGKRNWRQFTLSYRPFLLVVSRKDAINPDDWMVKQADGSKISKYASFDARYETEFVDKLTASGAKILADYTNWNSHDQFNGKHTNCSRLACVIDKTNEFCSKRDTRCGEYNAVHETCTPHCCFECKQELASECPGCCPKRKTEAEPEACKHPRLNALGNREFQCRMCKAKISA